MAETINFPNGGFEVVLMKRQDILDCIDNNITDKDIMNELISHLEITAERYLAQGTKVSIPYVGTIRRCPGKVMDRKNRQLYSDAAKVLNKQEYILLRRTTAKENDEILRYNRVYKIQIGQIIRKHINEYRRLAEVYDDYRAKLKLYFKYTVKAIDNKYAFDGDECYNPIVDDEET